jgi:hypothetical protein
MSSIQYYITKTSDKDGNEKYSPASPLDNFLMLKNHGKKFIIKFYEFYTGDLLEDDVSLDRFLERIVNNNTNNIHESTDHLMYSITIFEAGEEFTFYYVSLENSVRSIENDYPLITLLNNDENAPISRLDNICFAVNNMTKQNNTEFVVFFSESCRSSFFGSINDRKHEMSWVEIMKRMKKLTGLTCLTQKRNNEDSSGLSFGISAWISENGEQLVDNFFTNSILDYNKESKSFGSGVVGIRLKSGTIVWGVHFPIDWFNNRESKKNKGHIAMKNLQDLMDSYPGSFCAFGDMNTIPGLQNDTIRDAINNEKYELLLDNVYTFFGSNFDTVNQSNKINWQPFRESSTGMKYIFES